MPGLIPGFEYDIFISYRQKDNKGDKWVSSFVEALKTELESTFKEDISVYFDENPHDRLLATHNVDKSLEGKLKCLIFIPILSQTYCDPDSYAYQYEFLAFNRLANADQFGKNIRLRNGNYACRILPIRIHDLEPEDVKLFEKESGSVLRAMDFVFKTSSGVNRPLKEHEDHPNDNINKTFYSDQVNKVANAIKEIVLGLKASSDPGGKKKAKLSSEVAPSVEIADGKPGRGRFNQRSRQLSLIFILLILSSVGSVIIYRIINYGKSTRQLPAIEKSIAVLPFANDSPDKDNDYFCNGMMEEILNQLQKIGDLKVKSRTSVEKYRNPEKDIKVIGHELGVSLIMEGSVRKIGDDLRITAQLIDATTGDHIWSETYDGKYTEKIFEFQSVVAKKVAASLNAVITPQEEKRIEAKPTSEMLAHDLNLKGHEMNLKYNYSFDTLYLKLAMNLYDQALKIDPDYSDAIGGKGMVFRDLGIYDSALYYFEKTNDIDPVNMPGAGGIGAVYMYMNNYDSALKYFQIAIENNPDEPWAFAPMGQLLCMRKKDFDKGLKYYQKAYELGGNADAEINRHLAWIFSSIGDFQRAIKYGGISVSLRSDCGLFIEYDHYLAAQGKYSEALVFLDSISNVTPCEQKCDIMKFHLYTELKEFEKAQKFYNKAVSSGYDPTVAPDIYSADYIYIAYVYMETGRKKEALAILKSSVESDENFLAKGDDFMTSKLIKLRLAAAYAMMDRSKDAIKYLLELHESGIFEYPITINSFPGFDNLRNDPEFRATVKLIEDEKNTLRAQVKEMELNGELNL